MYDKFCIISLNSGSNDNPWTCAMSTSLLTGDKRSNSNDSSCTPVGDTHLWVTHTHLWATLTCGWHSLVCDTHLWHTPVGDTHLWVTLTCRWHSPVGDTHLWVTLTCRWHSHVGDTHLWVTLTCRWHSPVGDTHLPGCSPHSVPHTCWWVQGLSHCNSGCTVINAAFLLCKLI